jgi:Uma2 family endonuclease
MTTATAVRPITPDDLLTMPDGRNYELVHGELKEMNVSMESSYVAGRVFRAVANFVEPLGLGWVFPEGTSFRCFPFEETRVRRADTAFIRYDRLTEAEYRLGGHCRVVEVVSTHDTAYELELKTEEWLAAGAKLVWIVLPPIRAVRVYDVNEGHRYYRSAQNITGHSILPGFSVPVADLFQLPAGPVAGS